MKLSWSHKLFFLINAQIGKRSWLDKLMYFCASWLIYVLGAVILVWGTFFLGSYNPSTFILFFKLLLTSIICGIGLCYVFAVLWRHPRPIREFPQTKLLLHTIETWKTFPSDHTTISFIFAFITIIVGVPVLFGILLVLLASLVAVGRIYVGVHYPRDIAGGIVVAFVFALLAKWLLNNVTQPMYDGIKLIF